MALGYTTNTHNTTFSMKQNSELRLLESVGIWIVLQKEKIGIKHINSFTLKS